MSYRDGWHVGGSADTDVAKRWEAENTKLQKEIQERSRTFPKEFKALQAADILVAAWRYGMSKRAQYGGADFLDFFLGRGVETTGLTKAIDAAQQKEAWWRRQGKSYVYKKGQNKEWQELYNDVMKVYVEAAGVIGQRIVKDEAKQELARDLNPAAPTNIFKIVGIGLAAFAAFHAATRLLQKS